MSSLDTDGVARATMQKALGQLAVEGLLSMTPRGTFVSSAQMAPSGYDSLLRALRSGSVLADGETCTVTDAALVKPPVYVADILDLRDGERVVRRQWHTGRGQHRLALIVSWYPDFTGVAPDLLSTGASTAPRILRTVIDATGRRPTGSRDDIHGRECDAREASYLGLRVGAPITATAHRLWDETGVIAYEERCLPTRHTMSFEYEIPA